MQRIKGAFSPKLPCSSVQGPYHSYGVSSLVLGHPWSTQKKVGPGSPFGRPRSNTVFQKVILRLSQCHGLQSYEGGNLDLRIVFWDYSLVCFALFCLVKRIVQYFVKEWSEQKVSVTNVVGLYSTYQKCIIIGAPNSYQFREKLTWVFYQKNLLKSKHFFYEK